MTRITIYPEDARAIRSARRILSRLTEAGLESGEHGESIVAVENDLEAIEARIKASTEDSFSRSVPAFRHLEPVA